MLEYEIDLIKGYEKMYEYKTTTTTLRPCTWKQYNKDKSKELDKSIYDIIEGHFHMFSTEASEEGSDPVAIVEDMTGKVHLAYPSFLQFTDRSQNDPR